LGPLLFNIFINELRIKINFSRLLLFADDLKIFLITKSAEDCKLLQYGIDSVQKWRTENYMEINVLKTNTIYFTRKTNSIHFNYYVVYLSIILTDFVKDLEVMLDSTLQFHRHVDYLYSRSLKVLELIRFITCNFSSLDRLKVLYIAIICSQLEYASVASRTMVLCSLVEVTYCILPA
jgi:hypothetical protein